MEGDDDVADRRRRNSFCQLSGRTNKRPRVQEEAAARSCYCEPRPLFSETNFENATNSCNHEVNRECSPDIIDIEGKCINLEEFGISSEDPRLKSFLASWHLRNNIPQKAMTELLTGLKNNKDLRNIPDIPYSSCTSNHTNREEIGRTSITGAVNLRTPMNSHREPHTSLSSSASRAAWTDLNCTNKKETGRSDITGPINPRQSTSFHGEPRANRPACVDFPATQKCFVNERHNCTNYFSFEESLCLISADLYELSRMVHQLKTMTVNLMTQRGLSTSSQIDARETSLLVGFPVKTQEDFEALCRRLEDSNYSLRMTQALANAAEAEGKSKSVSRLTSSCLKHIVADEVANRYSWKGKTNKLRFAGSTVANLICDTVQKQIASANKNEIDEVMRRWLVQATIRIRSSIKLQNADAV